MSDIVPDLLEKIQKSFTNQIEQDKLLVELSRAVADGNATFREASRYAERLGDILSDVLKSNLTQEILPDGRMYYNIAERILEPMLRGNYDLAAEIAGQVQESLNRAAGLGLKAVRPALDTDRLSGIIDKISDAEHFESSSWLLGEPVTNFTMSAVEDTIRENVDFHARAGLQPKVKRIAESGCCKWCSRLAGEYDYPVDRDVYRRHENCRCIVLYDPGDGKVQNVHTKASYESQAQAERDARIERVKELERQAKRKNDLVHRLARSPEMLAEFTPEELAKTLKEAGYEVQPLNNGSLKGVLFDQGGGFKVNFEDGGMIMYHPRTRSHHGGEYYKISTGKGGTKRYERNGKELSE